MTENRQNFRRYDPDQLLLFPPDLREWLPPDHLVYFVMDVVDSLDLGAIVSCYDASRGGQPAYDPRLMVRLLLYAYCAGVPSSRKIEQLTYESVPFRVLTADQHPDHDTIAAFRQRHLEALNGLFVQVLRLCQAAGLVKLGHVALDGTKVRANASRHKAMSYGRMRVKERELSQEVRRLLKQAAAEDKREDQQYGKGRRGDELPKALQDRQSRLRKIREAKRALEEEAEKRASEEQEEYEAKLVAWEKRTERRGGRPPVPPRRRPDPRAQRNFTDPDSRIMPEGSGRGFAQSYNCQAVVDGHAQIIVAAGVTQQPTDRRQLQPMVEKLKENLQQEVPQRLSADSGYYSEKHAQFLEAEGIDAYLATGKVKHEEVTPPPRGRPPKRMTAKERMARKLRTIRGRCTYAQRKHIVEPVFGQIKSVRGFARFGLRGLEQVKAEWNLICLTHNLLKLFRTGWVPRSA